MVATTSKKAKSPKRAEAAPVVGSNARGRAAESDVRERRLFDSLRNGSPLISRSALRRALVEVGLRGDDPRLAETLAELSRDGAADMLDLEQFKNVVMPSVLLVERALQGRFVIPDFEKFSAELETLFEQSRQNRSGQVADYIPQLGRVPADLFGLAVATVDGQRLSLGDASRDFCLQSVSKAINYALALEEHGEATVHRHIGFEPSGQRFNELSLNEQGLPHNPMINAGGIMSSALIRKHETTADRFDFVMDYWKELSGGHRPGFSNSTYLSERRTADRNFALGYFMRENGAFPEGVNLVENLEFYFQCCSIEMDAESMSVVASTLANGGICPLTGKRVLRPETVQKTLSLMSSCGMYDYSGQWAFKVGLPAKSGVSGVIIMVIPNVMGICVWSPRLDALGNSVRGIDFAQRMIDTFNFHNYDSVGVGVHDKLDPRRSDRSDDSELSEALCWAASKGDLGGIRRLVARGADLDAADYDGRTALHLAASEGHTEVVAFFLERGVNASPRDRWGGTPRDDAEREGHLEVAKLLAA